MATRAVQTVVTYRAWDTSANAPKTGDSANHTLKWIKDGTSSTTTNAASEVDSTNAPGTYKVTLTNTETDCVFGVLAGKSSTANIVIFGVQIGFVYVPTAATTFGAFIGNANAAPAVDVNGRVDVIKVNGTSQTARDLGGQLDATVSSRATVTGVWQDTTAGDFTVASSIGKSIMNGVALGTGLTINDLTTKTGYALTAAYDPAKTALSLAAFDAKIGAPLTGTIVGDITRLDWSAYFLDNNMNIFDYMMLIGAVLLGNEVTDPDGTVHFKSLNGVKDRIVASTTVTTRTVTTRDQT